ncbi:MAG TPA: hypothetical protein VEI02_07735 [Planctomycetota bacterium]|nr:hypothetical protein [Planctomycetota bacterium]
MSRKFQLAAVAATLISSLAVAQAPNDTPAGATPFSEPASLPDDNTFSVVDGPLAACGIPTGDLWYWFIPTTTGVATATTCPTAGGFTGTVGTNGDTVIGVWTDGGGFPATAVTCNDDNCGVQVFASIVTFPVTAGVPMYISVAGWSGSIGTYVLDVTVAVGGPSVFSDDCSTATTVAEGVHGYDTTGFFSAGPNASCSAFFNDPADGWVAYVPSATGFATATNCSGSILAPGGNTLIGVDTYIAVWDGSTCPPTVQIGCADGSPQCGVLQSEVTWPVSAGNTYYVQVGNWGSSAAVSGNIAIAVNVPPPPAGPGDDCTVAVPMTVPGVTPYNSAGFTTPGPQAFCSAIGGPDNFDFWMSFTASTNGVAVASNCPGSVAAPGGSGSPTDTYLAAWDGAACPPTVQLACADGSPQCGVAQSEISFPIVAGNTYYVQVGTWGFSSANSGGVSIVEIPAPSNDDCVNAIPLAYGLNAGLTNLGATTSSPTGSCGAMGNDVWYSFTPTCAGNLVLETCGSGFDTVVAVFDACGGNEVGCNDDSGASGPCQFTLQSFLSIPVTAFNTYYIAVGGFGGQTGVFNLNVHCTYVHQWTTPNGSGSLRLENVDGPPGAIAYSGITLDILHPGLPAAQTFPNGWFYGVPLSFTEFLTQLSLPPPQPFLSLLDGTGYSLNLDLPGGFVSAFIGANLWSVGVALDPATGFSSVADTTAPTAYTIN